MTTQSPIIVDLPDEAATAALAEDVALCLAAGDVVALAGGLGAGKTSFARALIRAVADDDRLEVPSPTFTLVQSYPTPRLTIAHFDLYRIADAEELAELGLDEAIGEGAVLVEWPERAAARLPAERLDITFEIAGSGRRAVLTPGTGWLARLSRSRAVRTFLDRSGWPGATRRYLQGDASTRRYERIGRATGRAVLMDWPPSVTAAIRDPRAAYRARDVRAFVAVDRALRGEGLSAPAILAENLAQGFLLLEDLGPEGVLKDGAPDPERYRLAINVLALIHSQPRPSELPLADGAAHRLLPLDASALTAEIALFTDWYVPHATGRPLGDAARVAFADTWAALFARLADAEKSWVLFDVQSSNLFWLADRKGLARIGLIDFQDMFLGPSAFDVASLCQDMRVTISAPLETALRGHYVDLRRAADPRFNEASFAAAYAILAAERSVKNLGVFARLADHVGKPQYLQHIPRLRAYLRRTLAHPVLSSFALWYERHLPSA